MSNLRLNKFKCPFPRSLRQPVQRTDLEHGFSDFKTMISLHQASLFLKLRLNQWDENRYTWVLWWFTDLWSGYSWGPWEASGPSIPLQQEEQGGKKNKNSRSKCLDPTYAIISKMSTSISFTDFPRDSQVPAHSPACLIKGYRWVVIGYVAVHSQV